MATTLSLNIANFAVAGGVTVLLLTAVRVIYNLYYHPLRRFPGPLTWRASRVPFVLHLLRGSLAKDILALHRKYGPVVRIAPNELAFIESDAWKDIYGHRVGAAHGLDEMQKYKLFYRTKGMPPSVLAEDRENHAILRRQLSHGFSDRSMREQEPIIGGYVDLLIKRLKEHCVSYGDEQSKEPKPKALDMTAWYNWTTFDVIGDLAFGEPFGCLENAKYHPWVAAINGTVRSGPVLLALKHLGLDNLMLLIMKYAMTAKKEHDKRTSEKLERRMALDVERPDLVEGLLREKEEWNMGFERLQINASLLIIAGSETTATLLSGVTYLLLSNPEALKKLTEEVRSIFRSDKEITLTSVANLPYMLACLNEALRCYPPVPIGMPRQVPKGGAAIAGTFVPEDSVVSVWQWAMYHAAEHWKQPFSFRPERFLGDPSFANDKLDTLQPFSIGPRNCIGRNLAISEMRLILARIVFNFDLKLANKQQDWLDQNVYVLWQKPPLEVYLTPVRE